MAAPARHGRCRSRHFFWCKALNPIRSYRSIVRKTTAAIGLSWLVAGGLSLPVARAQTPGCTDPQAENFTPAATFNDGSCVYASTNYSPVFLTALPESVRETSGIIFHGGLLWTHNDSGNQAVLYGLDTLTGQVVRTVVIDGPPPVDWEDIAIGDTHIYIGDIGNNAGNRTDLRILRIDLAGWENKDTVVPEVIAFSYPDQTDFSPGSQQTEFDAEALVYHNDSLHIWTKNWQSQTSRYYTVPDLPGSHVAVLRDSFDTGGLITGAAVSPGGKEIVLTGYQSLGFGIWTCFAWLLWDFPVHQPFDGHKRRLEWGTALATGQLEAVWLKADQTGWITGEGLEAGPFQQPARLSAIDLRTFFTGTTSVSSALSRPPALTVFPQPARHELHVVLEGRQGTVQVWDLHGRMVRQIVTADGHAVFRVDALPAGVYIVRVEGWPSVARSVLISP